MDEIRNGVEIFEPRRPTCLRPDWSKQGIGYFLLQNHCECPSPAGDLPSCCKSGWRIVLAGSRFLSSAESNYVAIKGEALAVAWGLEQTKYFTMGCPTLVVVTDHKPLVRILDTKPLRRDKPQALQAQATCGRVEIQNRTLARQKQLGRGRYVA